MKYEFTDKTRELFNLGNWMNDWEDGRNDANALHHIFGRVSNSPFNCAPLNNNRNHLPEGRRNLPAITNKEVQQKYLQKTKKFLKSINYKPNEKDLKFLEKYDMR